MRLLRWSPLALLACADLLTVTVDTEASTEVEGAGALGGLLEVLDFTGLSGFDVTVEEELANQGVEPGDIREAHLTAFVLSTPDGDDLSFLDTFALFVEADGVARTRVAHAEDFPEGVTSVELALDDVDLTPFIVAPSMTLSTEVEASPPVDTTTVDADVSLEVTATAQGACNAAKDR